MNDKQTIEQLSDKEVRELAVNAGLPPQQANLAVASNQVFGTKHATTVIAAFVKINTAGREAGKIEDIFSDKS